MKLQHTSIFNLIEIFRKGKHELKQGLNSKTHCEQKHHHDFYCDSENSY